MVDGAKKKTGKKRANRTRDRKKRQVEQAAAQPAVFGEDETKAVDEPQEEEQASAPSSTTPAFDLHRRPVDGTVIRQLMGINSFRASVISRLVKRMMG